MNKVTRTLALCGAAVLAGVSVVSAVDAQVAFGPVLNKPTAALAAFDRAFRAVRDYTTTDVVFEQLNDFSRVELRTYAYKVLAPHAALAAIVAGPGQGAVATWNGGDTVRAHPGGALAPIKLALAIDDPRVQSLRGDTIDTGTFTYDLQYMLATPGELADSPGPTIAGVSTTAVTLKVKDPAVAAVTKVELDLSATSHLPVRRQLYVGSTVMKTETFTDTKLNVGLNPHDFDGPAT
ncbi:MAG: hypothetical protein IAI50_02330 [Candidatus Eremiobacteraeota bacterium]|nr:hypothetical protein [Candidatus Eremiobacteraeota bacterium]